MQGKTVVVTGGFGALGRVVAEVAAARGASIAVLDHAPAAPEGMAALGKDALLIGGLDLSSADVATKAMADVKAKFGRVDALLNIAGGFQWETVEGGKDESWERMYRAEPHDGAQRLPCGAAVSDRERRRPHRQCWGAVRPARRIRLRPLCREQVGGAPADREPGGRTEAEGRHRQRGAAVDHRHGREPSRHAESGFRPLGRAGRSRRGHAVSRVGRSEGDHRRADLPVTGRV